jgi:hypothetical protein
MDRNVGNVPLAVVSLPLNQQSYVLQSEPYTGRSARDSVFPIVTRFFAGFGWRELMDVLGDQLLTPTLVFVHQHCMMGRYYVFTIML